VILSRCVVDILGVSNPLLVVLSSRIDEGSGVIELLLIPTDCAFAEETDNMMRREGISKRLIQKNIGF
jgi:hypothetical protein